MRDTIIDELDLVLHIGTEALELTARERTIPLEGQINSPIALGPR